ncbi:hypothetical protein ACFQY5_30345 [Paeniroseomonas aquatica]|uniref:hypothetical protein n=1 Tax=Paeniroseomonas aquatica TaxID=373043 RepID=UPI0036206C52
MVRRRLMMIALPLLAAPALSGCAGSGRDRPEPPMTAALRFAAALEAADPAVDAAVARMDGFERMAAREDSAIGFAVGGRAAPPSRFTAAPAGAAEAAGRVLSPAFTALSDYGHLLDQVAEGERIQGKPGPSGQQLAAAVGNGLAAVQAAGGTPVPEPVRTAGLAGIAALSDMPETMTRGGARPTLAGMVAAGQPHLQAVVALLRAVIGPEIGQGPAAPSAPGGRRSMPSSPASSPPSAPMAGSAPGSATASSAASPSCVMPTRPRAPSPR